MNQPVSRNLLLPLLRAQEVRECERLLASLPPQHAASVSALWESLIRARYHCELMASRAVRVTKVSSWLHGGSAGNRYGCMGAVRVTKVSSWLHGGSTGDRYGCMGAVRVTKVSSWRHGGSMG